MNIGNVYYRNKSYSQALTYYDKSNVMFAAVGDSINLVQVLQNRGVIYYNLHEFDKAENCCSQQIKQVKSSTLTSRLPVQTLRLQRFT
jgi:tetratricopeptide (TPR) repeat protein